MQRPLPTASAVSDFRLFDGDISWEERETTYRDMPGAGGCASPVAFEAQCRFFLEEDKARYEYSGTCFDADPDSGARIPSTSVFPNYLSRER